MPNASAIDWNARRKELAEQFVGASFGFPPDISSVALEQLLAALSSGGEEAIQKTLAKNPYLIQYAVESSGHHGIWAFPKPVIKPPAADGTKGLVPDFLIATRSSLGYFWHIVELKRFDVQFANSDGSGLSPDGHKAVVQCNAYLSHFQDYVDVVRSNIRIPEIVQPRGAILLIGDSDKESEIQRQSRANFVRNQPNINVVSYRRIIAAAESDLVSRRRK